MHPTNKTARVAGAVYLSMAATAPFSLIYVPRTLIVPGNATATANNILAHEMLFRLGIVGDLVGLVSAYRCPHASIFSRSADDEHHAQTNPHHRP